MAKRTKKRRARAAHEGGPAGPAPATKPKADARAKPKADARAKPEADGPGAPVGGPVPAWLAVARSPLAAAALLLATVVAAYAGSLDHPFQLDDFDAIPRNESIRSLSTALSPPYPTTASGRQVLNLSLALDRVAAGADEPRRFRQTNVALHWLAALVLFGLVRRSLLLPRLRSRYGEAAPALALAVALLWVAHPNQTVAVTYIVQRAELLVGLFYLLTLYGLLRGSQAGGRSRHAWYVAAIVSCALGMGTKEVMVSAPVVALLFDRLVIAGSFRELLRRRWWVHLGLAACWLVLYAALASINFRRGSGDRSMPRMSRWLYLASQPRVILTHYFAGYLWPSSQVFDYHYAPLARGAGQVVPYAAGLAALLGGIGWAVIRRPALGFVGLAFFFYIGISSSIIPINQVAAEHRIYVPSAVLVLPLVLGAYHAWLRLRPLGGHGSDGGAAGAPSTPGRGRLAHFAPLLVVLALVTVTLVALTRRRNHDYRSALALWQDTARKVPTASRAQINTGYELAKQGKHAEAIAYFDRAAALYPGAFLPRLYRGKSNEALGRTEAALADFSAAIRARPDLPELYYRRGIVRIKLRQTEPALADFDAAADRAPEMIPAVLARANVRAQLGRFALAAKDYRRVLAVHPERIETRRRLALVLLEVGRLAEARAEVAAIRARGGEPGPMLLGSLRRAAGGRR